MSYTIEQVTEAIKQSSEEKLNTVISQGVLKLSKEEEGTVSFVFWLYNLVERDLEASIHEPWKILSATTPASTIELAKRKMEEFAFGPQKSDTELNELLKQVPPEVAGKIRKAVDQNFQLKRNLGINDLPYLADKIKFYEKLFGANNVTSILWPINTIRNDVSHNRFSTLTYKGRDLKLLATKQELLIDYLTAVRNPDHSHSPFEAFLGVGD